MARLVPVLALLLVSLFASPRAAQAPAPMFADSLVDAVGVNIHLHHTDTPYANFDMVKERLTELGVRHVRDGLIATTWQPYYERHNALGALGIRGMFIAAHDVTAETLRGYPARMSATFEAYESPNELDLSGLAGWTTNLRSALVQLSSVRSASTSVSGFPIYGPSLTSPAAYDTLGDVSAYYDTANLHNYMAGRHPGTPGWGENGYGSIDWNLALARRYAPDKPVATTETGYWDDPAVPHSVPATVVARYMPRLLLEQYRKGLTRTYIYELVDAPVAGIAAHSGYGLVRADGTPKPSFRAVANLLRVFNDPGKAMPPVPFGYTVDGGTEAVRHLAFQKKDGSTLLAIWIEASAYDLDKRQTLEVPPQTVRVTVPEAFPLARIYRWLEDGNATESTTGAGQATLTIPVTDSLTVLSFRPTFSRPARPVNLRVER